MSTALQLLDQAENLGAQGANGTATNQSRTILAQQVESIQEQMVALANTEVSGQYVFSGDQSGSQPYALQLTNPVQVGQTAAGVPRSARQYSTLSGGNGVGSDADHDHRQ